MSKLSEAFGELAVVQDTIADLYAIALANQRSAVAMEDTLTANKWSIRCEVYNELLTVLDDRGVQLRKRDSNERESDVPLHLVP